MLKYQKGYIFNGTTFVVRKEDVHNASDDMFVEATALLPVPDVITNGEYIRAMSDGNLAELISNHSVESLCDIVCGGECNAIATLEKSAHMRCVEIVTAFIKRPVEGE